MHPDDVFHVIIDALAIIAKMSPEDLARYNAGRPPWDWYDNLDDGLDPKVTERGWKAMAVVAAEFATNTLDTGTSEEVLALTVPLACHGCHG
jgi:hypothetical protein